MSLVEKALKKMQESGAAPSASLRAGLPKHQDDEAAFGTVAEASALPQPQRRSSRPVQERTNPGRMVVINRNAIRAAGLLPPEYQERQIADQYRQIKRPLIAAALKKAPGDIPNLHLVMITSAMPGDGKTFTSINLAISMSLEKDINVLLIDADVAKPHISRLFGVEDEPGLLDALHDESIDVESLILPTDIPGLSILPAGRRMEIATELLASQRMLEIATKLANYDTSRIAVIDSPPLLLTNESRVLAQAVGQIVVVVRSGKTPQQDLFDALSHLEPGKAIGLVLNQSLSSTPGYYYGYDADRSIPM